jgi:hypothetical protein
VAKLVHQMANLTVSSLPAILMPVAEAARAAFAPNGPFTAMSEPAILLGEAGVISANGAGREIADDKHATAELADIGKLARSTKAGGRRILASTFRGRDALFEFDIAPWRDKLSLALGRDVTVVTGIREALQLSRERYRSLLAMAVDCIWEAGADGALSITLIHQGNDEIAVLVIISSLEAQAD